VLIQDSDYEHLKDFEKEVDNVISDEQKSISILNEEATSKKYSGKMVNYFMF
jgi:hypothetical protein